MFYLNEMCCLCLNERSDLLKLTEIQSGPLSYYNKIIICIPQMIFTETNNEKCICRSCCEFVDQMFNFRDMCLRNGYVLKNYISKLRNVNKPREDVNITAKEFQVYLDQNETKNGLKNVRATKKENNCDVELKKPKVSLEELSKFEENVTKSEKIPEVVETSQETKIQKISEAEQKDEEKPIATPPETNKTIRKNNQKVETNTKNDNENIKTLSLLQINELEKLNAANVSGDEPVSTISPTRRSNNHLKCPHCNKICTSLQTFKRHFKTHKKRMPYKCNACKKCFIFSADLVKHLKTHINDVTDVKETGMVADE